MFSPNTVEELQAIVSSESGLLPRGGGSKPVLSTPPDGAHILDMRSITGIIEYEPSEYTFTAFAGTPLKDIAWALLENGQYMPFDPILVEKGATLGGTVAANTSGSGRFRYGGVRDFILGVQFVDGQGQLVRSGGKVVKNSAGFDLPKFFVGSLGRYGVLTELTFKVFPQPLNYITLYFTYETLEAALEAIYCLNTSPLEMDALDIEGNENNYSLVIRLGGLAEALAGRKERLQLFLNENTRVTQSTEVDDVYWSGINTFSWVGDGQSLVKVPIAPKQIPAFDVALSNGVKRRYAVGGNIVWVAGAQIDSLNALLESQGLVGLRLYGEVGNPYLGKRKGVALAKRVKQALDPNNTFLEA